VKKGLFAAIAALVSVSVLVIYQGNSSSVSATGEVSSLRAEPLEIVSYKTILPDRSGTELVSDTALKAQLREIPASGRAAGVECSDDSINKNPRSCLGLMLRNKYSEIASRFDGFKDRALLQMFESRKLHALVTSPDGFEGSYRSGNSEHIAAAELSQSVPLSWLCSTQPKTWADAIAAAKPLVHSADSKMWTVNGLPFVAGNFVVKGYLRSLPLHNEPGSVNGDSMIDRDVLVMEKYQNQSVIYRSEFLLVDEVIKEVRISSPYALSVQKQSDGSVLRRLGGFALFQKNKLELFELGPNAEDLNRLSPFARQLSDEERDQMADFARRFFKCLASLNKALLQ
jgi:hypothetical protein